MSAAPKQVPPQSAKQIRAAESVAAFAAPAVARLERPRRSFRGSSTAAVDRAKEETARFLDAGDWSQARGTHLVALYAWLHEKVYGVETAELDGKSWAAAASMAQRMVDSYFDRSFEKAVAFMHWTWRREQERDKWARANGRSRGRVGWRLQFSGTIVTDYRREAKLMEPK